MKKTLLIFAALLAQSAFAQQVKPDAYESYLRSVQAELNRAGTQVSINTPNPFITGTALNNYYLNEKILLLERDAYFMIKSNKLETTEEVADYQHRLKVLTSHANNILIQMVRALQSAKEEGFVKVEAPKNQLQWEELLETCKKSPDCVSRKLESGEVAVQNDVLDSFALSTQIFKGIPHMHAVEFASLFQLVQLLYLESLEGHARLARVEFDVFLKKQKALLKQIEGNKLMTKKEKEFNRTMVSNTVNKWKKKILTRKFDDKAQFRAMADKVKAENQALIRELEEARAKNPKIVPEAEVCKRLFKKDKRCELRQRLEDHIAGIKRNQDKFGHRPDKQLPKSFFDNI